MFQKIVLPVLAFSGILFCIFMIFYSAKKPPVKTILFQPPTPPYEHFIAGEGIIESVNSNTPLSAPFQDIITDIYVSVGDIVKKGDKIYKLDTRHLESQRNQALADKKVAEIEYENQKIQFDFYEKLKLKSAVSKQVYEAAYYAREAAKKKIESLEALANIFKTDIERSTIHAPIDGEILQTNIKVGQSALLNTLDSLPQVIFGNTSELHVRVDIDEDNAWRYKKGLPATAFVRGNSNILIPLEFAYLEPYMIPKVLLSSADTARVDTRVLQVVYKFEKNKYPVFVGQILDIYIQTQ